jgi:hypothetical protein
MNPNVRAFLDLSTKHLSQSTRNQLDRDAAATVEGNQHTRWVAGTPHGWFVFADEECDQEYFPADLIACMKKASELGADYILFDCDADDDVDLPSYVDGTDEIEKPCPYTTEDDERIRTVA